MIFSAVTAGKIWRRYWFEISLAVIFTVLVAFGVTGSSLGFYKQLPGCEELISFRGERKLFGVYRGVRGDEFIAHGTSTAMQQYHHSPAFPRINRNCGVEGRCYLTLHDNGAPVKHFSMLGRPSVWGFFFLDLRRALSWYWFLPLFLGIWGCKFFLDKLFPGQEKINTVLSLTLALSAYAGAWSFWPVNNVYGIFIAGGVVIEIFRSTQRRNKFLLAVFAAWMLYCSFMSLYMPRVIPALYFAAAIVLGYCHLNKLWKKLIQAENLLPLLLIVVLFGILALLWYIDASLEIERVLTSVYPGVRRHPGGTMPWWLFHAGYFSMLTIYKTDFMNQSELQGFFNILPLFLIWFILNYRKVKYGAMWKTCFIFAAAVVIYQVAGFPQWLADITFMSKCIPERCSWVLNILQLFMLALYWHENRSAEFTSSATLRRWIIPAMMLYGGITIAIVPSEFFDGIRAYLPGYVVWGWAAAVILILGLLGKLMFEKPLFFILVYSAVNILPGVIFNPVCIAPEKIENRFTTPAEVENMPYKGRLLLATDNNFLAVAYSLCGGRVFNGYFMYYDAEIDELLFKDQTDRSNFHRMNHLDICLSDGDSAVITASSPYSDRIQVILNGQKYDFSKLPVDVVGTYNENRAKLERNPSLEFWKSGKNLCFFKVIHKKNCFP